MTTQFSARILLVDDEPNLLLTVGDQLRLEGYEVVTATSGDEALHVLRSQPPDLIILDISMPGMTGLALLKKLSGPDGKPHYPILIFTARSNMEQFFETTGVEGFLAKASDPTQLIAEVRRILLKTRPQAAKIAGPANSPKPRRVVLILEDEPILNIRLKTSFTIAGYEAIGLTDSHQLAETLQNKTPHVILLKSLLSKTTGVSIAANLADYTSARGISVILYDSSGLHKPGEKFDHVDKFVPTNLPAELVKAVASVVG